MSLCAQLSSKPRQSHPRDNNNKGRFTSSWALLSRTGEPLANLAGRPGWLSPTTSRHVRPSNDHYSNILQALALH